MLALIWPCPNTHTNENTTWHKGWLIFIVRSTVFEVTPETRHFWSYLWVCFHSRRYFTEERTNWRRKIHSECARYSPAYWNPRLQRKEQKEGASRVHHWSLCFLSVAFSVLPPQLEGVASRVLHIPPFVFKYNLLNPYNVTCICVISGLTTGIGYSTGERSFSLVKTIFFNSHYTVILYLGLRPWELLFLQC